MLIYSDPNKTTQVKDLFTKSANKVLKTLKELNILNLCAVISGRAKEEGYNGLKECTILFYYRISEDEKFVFESDLAEIRFHETDGDLVIWLENKTINKAGAEIKLRNELIECAKKEAQFWKTAEAFLKKP